MRDATGRTPLHRAAGAGQVDRDAKTTDVARCLALWPCMPLTLTLAPSGSFPTFASSSRLSHQGGVVALLLESRAQVDLPDETGGTALHWASYAPPLPPALLVVSRDESRVRWLPPCRCRSYASSERVFAPQHEWPFCGGRVAAAPARLRERARCRRRHTSPTRPRGWGGSSARCCGCARCGYVAGVGFGGSFWPGKLHGCEP